MTGRPGNTGGASSAELLRDLRQVLPAGVEAGPQAVRASVAGRETTVEEAAAEAVRRLREARAVGIVGVHGLSIEGVRQAVRLAERARGRVLAMTSSAPPLPVTQTATMGHLLACDLMVAVRGEEEAAEKHAFWEAWRSAGRSQVVRVKANLATVLELRAAMKAGHTSPVLDAVLRVRRVGVVIEPGADGRVVSQWHRLAAQVQGKVRMAVAVLPGRESANARGAAEVVTWQTGLSLGAGGVDFSEGVPRRCGDAEAALARGALDLVVEVDGGAGGAETAGVQRIAIGRRIDNNAAVSFATPGLAVGLGARVMRWDGVVLWMCDDPSDAPGDPTAGLLERLADGMEGRR